MYKRGGGQALTGTPPLGLTQVPRSARDDASHTVALMEKGEHHHGWCSPFYLQIRCEDSVIPRSVATRDLNKK